MNATLVFLMSIRAMGHVMEKLIQAGMDPDMHGCSAGTGNQILSAKSGINRERAGRGLQESEDTDPGNHCCREKYVHCQKNSPGMRSESLPAGRSW